MTCSYQTLIFCVMNLVIKHYLGCLRRAIDDIYSRFHAVFDGFLPLETHLYQRRKAAMIEEAHISKVIFPAEFLTGILKIQRV